MNLASRKQIPCLVERTKQGIAERKIYERGVVNSYFSVPPLEGENSGGTVANSTTFIIS